MLGSGFNSQLVPNPNAAGAQQQQQPSDSMQSIGGLTNPEHSRLWMQMQQQVNQQRTTSAGDMVGSQVTLHSSFILSLSLFRFSLPPFLPFLVSHPLVVTLRPPLCFLLQTQPSDRPSRLARSGLLTSAWLLLRFFSPCLLPHHHSANSQLISLSFRWLANSSYSASPFPWAPAPACSITTCSANSKTTELSTR